MTPSELETLLSELGEARYRSTQILYWVYQKGVRDFSEMTNLSKALKRDLEERFYISLPQVLKEESSRDGTRKFLLGLEDGERVESVLIKDGGRITACLSTQVGCPLNCTFCLTGKMGFRRDLTAGEIVGQVLALQGQLKEKERITNLVLMGMGEPLLNWVNTEKALRLMMYQEALGFSPRRITLSTAGIPPGIINLGSSGLTINLAISLNAASDTIRSFLMPINKKYPIREIIKACKEFPIPPRQRITFEYVLIDGVNDDPKDAITLSELLRSLRCKINLIPLNPCPGLDYRPSPPSRVEAFQKILQDRGYQATIRKSKGQEIRAACGQLGWEIDLKKLPSPGGTRGGGK